MKKSKIVILSLIAIALVIAGGVVYIVTNIDSIVKDAIEKYGSQATGTEVGVGSVSIRLAKGEGAISRLTVGNPPGFSAPDIFKLGNISVRIDVRSVTKTPIVIDEIRISGPQVFYEMNSRGTANVDVLKKNLQRSGAAEKKEPSGEKPKGGEVKLLIRKLVFENGRIEVRIAALGDKQAVVDLPRLVMSDIGGKGGATPSQIAQTVATALAEQTAGAVARSQGERLLRRGAEDLLNRYLGK